MASRENSGKRMGRPRLATPGPMPELEEADFVGKPLLKKMYTRLGKEAGTWRRWVAECRKGSEKDRLRQKSEDAWWRTQRKVLALRDGRADPSRTLEMVVVDHTAAVVELNMQRQRTAAKPGEKHSTNWLERRQDDYDFYKWELNLVQNQQPFAAPQAHAMAQAIPPPPDPVNQPVPQVPFTAHSAAQSMPRGHNVLAPRPDAQQPRYQPAFLPPQPNAHQLPYQQEFYEPHPDAQQLPHQQLPDPQFDFVQFFHQQHSFEPQPDNGQSVYQQDHLKPQAIFQQFPSQQLRARPPQHHAQNPPPALGFASGSNHIGIPQQPALQEHFMSTAPQPRDQNQELSFDPGLINEFPQAPPAASFVPDQIAHQQVGPQQHKPQQNNLQQNHALHPVAPEFWNKGQRVGPPHRAKGLPGAEHNKMARVNCPPRARSNAVKRAKEVSMLKSLSKHMLSPASGESAGGSASHGSSSSNSTTPSGKSPYSKSNRAVFDELQASLTDLKA